MRLLSLGRSVKEWFYKGSCAFIQVFSRCKMQHRLTTCLLIYVVRLIVGVVSVHVLEKPGGEADIAHVCRSTNKEP